MEDAVPFLMKEYRVSDKIVEECLKRTGRIHKISPKKVGEMILSLRVAYLDRLPNEILLKLMREMDYPTLTLFCSASKKIRERCQDEPFWKKKMARDFPGKEKRGTSFKSSYHHYYRTSLLPYGEDDLTELAKKGEDISQLWEPRLGLKYKGYDFFEDYLEWIYKQLEKDDQEVYLGYNKDTDTFIAGIDYTGEEWVSFGGEVFQEGFPEARTIEFEIRPDEKEKFKITGRSQFREGFYAKDGVYDTQIEPVSSVIDLRLD